MTKIFIAHASEDKDAIARPLAEALGEQGYEVWYDEYSLKLGDSLSREINRGLAECDYGVVILSHSFFEKDWPQKELEGLFAIENTLDSTSTTILPIWHEIEFKDVAAVSPILADRVAVKSSAGLEKVVTEIGRVALLLQPAPSPTQTQRRSATQILSLIEPEGPVLPSSGYSEASAQVIQSFVDLWEENGNLSLIAGFDLLPAETNAQSYFAAHKTVFLLPTHGMHQTRIEILDHDSNPVGMLWTPPGISDNDYHRAVEFFLDKMELLERAKVEVTATLISSTNDTFWVTISDPDDSLPKSAE